jgi:hypothetical protein
MAMEPAEQLNELVSADGRNRKAVLCQRCGSRVLQPGTALFSRRQVGRQVRGHFHAHPPSGRSGRSLIPGSSVSGDGTHPLAFRKPRPPESRPRPSSSAWRVSAPLPREWDGVLSLI